MSSMFKPNCTYTLLVLINLSFVFWPNLQALDVDPNEEQDESEQSVQSSSSSEPESIPDEIGSIHPSITSESGFEVKLS